MAVLNAGHLPQRAARTAAARTGGLTSERVGREVADGPPARPTSCCTSAPTTSPQVGTGRRSSADSSGSPASPGRPDNASSSPRSRRRTPGRTAAPGPPRCGTGSTAGCASGGGVRRRRLRLRRRRRRPGQAPPAARTLRLGGRPAPVPGRIPGARRRRRRHPPHREPLPGRPQPVAGGALRWLTRPACGLLHRPSRLSASRQAGASTATSTAADRSPCPPGPAVRGPSRRRARRRDAPPGGEPPQLLHAQRRQPQGEDLGRPEPAGGRPARAGVRGERRHVGVEVGILRRQLHAPLALRRDAVPGALTVVTGSHRCRVRPAVGVASGR